MTALHRVTELNLEWEPCPADSPQFEFVQKALVHIEAFASQQERVPSYESSHFPLAAGLLTEIKQQQLSSGLRYCEWGSGFGVNTCLAAMAGFKACGIEIEQKLNDEAVLLAAQAGVDANFHVGSYQPDSFFDPDTKLSEFRDLLGFSPFDFDLIYIYPWPVERDMIDHYFDQYGNPGSILISYQGGGRFRLSRHL